MITTADPDFPADRFVARALEGYEALELLDRGRKIADALAENLPPDYAAAVDVLVRSLGPPLERTEGNGMAPFLYLPHTVFVAVHGLADFDASMRAQHAITQRFSCEFSIRTFIAADQERTLDVLDRWTTDESVHVRRLVSEGTRPRLPWAGRLRAFVEDPRPILPLLERLRDDPEEYVRRSVANNLNDISKDHPGLVVETAEVWLAGSVSDDRRRLVRHALRTLAKAGDADALDVLGFPRDTPVSPSQITVAPTEARIGESVLVTVELSNPGATTESVIAELNVVFVKASGGLSPKTFRLGEAEIGPRDVARLAKRVSLKQHTTRTHYPGRHTTEVLVNGSAYEGPSFDLGPA